MPLISVVRRPVRSLELVGLVRDPLATLDLVDGEDLGHGVAELVEADLAGDAVEGDAGHRLDRRVAGRLRVRRAGFFRAAVCCDR